jgi:drug/metabolite transporter (DMT)-like permease
VDTRKALDGRATALMALLCLTWSLQQIALKATAPDVAPLLQIALRSGIAAVLVMGVMLARREQFTEGALRPGLLAGFLFAFEYLLLGEGLRHTSAGHAVVLLYTGPVFAALGLHWKLPSERLAPGQWAGIALAFVGIAVTFIGRQGPAREAAGMLAGDLLCVAAGAAWGATTVVIRCTSLSTAPATETLLYQLLAAFVLLIPAGALLGQLTFHATPLAIGSLAFQSVVVSFASFLAWFALLRRYLASRLGVFSFLTPLFAVALGGVVLDERIEQNFMAGALLVLAGIVLVSGYGWIVQNIVTKRVHSLPGLRR